MLFQLIVCVSVVVVIFNLICEDCQKCKNKNTGQNNIVKIDTAIETVNEVQYPFNGPEYQVTTIEEVGSATHVVSDVVSENVELIVADVEPENEIIIEDVVEVDVVTENVELIVADVEPENEIIIEDVVEPVVETNVEPVIELDVELDVEPVIEPIKEQIIDMKLVFAQNLLFNNNTTNTTNNFVHEKIQINSRNIQHHIFS